MEVNYTLFVFWFISGEWADPSGTAMLGQPMTEPEQEQVQKAPLGNGVDTCNYLRQGGKRGYLLERLWQYMFTGHQRRPVA